MLVVNEESDCFSAQSTQEVRQRFYTSTFTKLLLPPPTTPKTHRPQTHFFGLFRLPPGVCRKGRLGVPARRQRAGAGALSGEGALFGRSIACNLGVTRSTNVSEAGPLLGGFFFWVLDLVEHIADEGPL